MANEKKFYTKVKFYDLDKKSYFTLSLGPREVSDASFIQGLATSFGHHNFRRVAIPVKRLNREDFNRMVDVLSEDKSRPVDHFTGISLVLPRRGKK